MPFWIQYACIVLCTCVYYTDIIYPLPLGLPTASTSVVQPHTLEDMSERTSDIVYEVCHCHNILERYLVIYLYEPFACFFTDPVYYTFVQASPICEPQGPIPNNTFVFSERV